MRVLVKNANRLSSFLPSWKPRDYPPEFAEHIEKLCIPALSDGGPSLLLHDLGEEKDELDRARLERIDEIFLFSKHTCVTRLSVNFMGLMTTL